MVEWFFDWSNTILALISLLLLTFIVDIDYLLWVIPVWVMAYILSIFLFQRKRAKEK